MVCKEYNCIFIHIPKVAGQSIEQFFLQLAGLSWNEKAAFLLRFNYDPLRGPRRLAHLTAAEYTACGHLKREEFESYFKFAFVRNPWDRIVSEYEFRRRRKQYDFKSFLFKHFPTPGPSDSYRHVVTQCEFVIDKAGRQLVEFIGRYERLQSDFDEICKHLNIKDSALPHINKASQREHYAQYYDAESKAFVADVYKNDILTFNYAFDG